MTRKKSSEKYKMINVINKDYIPTLLSFLKAAMLKAQKVVSLTWRLAGQTGCRKRVGLKCAFGVQNRSWIPNSGFVGRVWIWLQNKRFRLWNSNTRVQIGWEGPLQPSNKYIKKLKQKESHTFH